MESVLVDDPLEVRRFLIEGIKTAALATIWSAGQKSVISARLSRIDEPAGVIHAKASADCDPAAFAAELRAQGADGGHCYFSVPLPSASIFFKGELKGSGASGLQFALPEVLYKTQRRGDMRLVIPAEGRPVVKVRSRPHPLLDISSGGLCFLASDVEATAFCQGIEIEELELELGGRVIRTQAEVRHAEFHVLTDDRLTGTRVGLQFKSLSADDARLISAYVFEGTRKLLLSNL